MGKSNRDSPTPLSLSLSVSLLLPSMARRRHCAFSRASSLHPALLVALFLLGCACSPWCFVRSDELPGYELERERDHQRQRGPRVLSKVIEDGDKVITEELVKNNFVLDFVPECSSSVVEDYDPDKEIRTFITFNGTAYLNAWASDEDFESAPRYVEAFKGIKYGSVYKRFARSKQAYGYNYARYNTTDGGKTREIFINATKFGPKCIQPGIEEKHMKENCLYLNIWRPSRWKQSLNKTSICQQTFMGKGKYKKECEVILTTRTTNPDGSITLVVDKKNTSETVKKGGNFDKDGSIYDENTDVLNNNSDEKLSDGEKKKKDGVERRRAMRGAGLPGGLASEVTRELQGNNMGSTFDDLEDSLKDLNDLIEGSEDSGDDEDSEENSIEDANNNTLTGIGTYAIDRSGLLPVMVYIHGGGFTVGSGSDPMFNGAKVASRGQVIVITLNYRLGVFGFLPTFGRDQWKINGGMNGFMDIVNALLWIHRNIIQWGGNPKKITIVGPSSTPAVCLATMCPLLVGKFQRAILTSSIRETELENGSVVTRNGVSGASCLTSEQEPYQPLEGRIEITDKFLDYINETHYNYPQNPDPTRQDLIDWLSSLAQNSTEILQIANDENTVFVPQRPAHEFDYNRDGNITFTQQRRTFMTWDNEVFPRLPVELEDINPIDMIVGVRGNHKNKGEAPKKVKKPPKQKKPNSNKGNNRQQSDEAILSESNFKSSEDAPNNVMIIRKLEAAADAKGNETEEDDAFLADFSETNGIDCGNATAEGGRGNETECEEELYEYVFDFSGTTSDQDLCVSKQFAEIAARNVEGNVYGYVFDDGTELHGDRRLQSLYIEESPNHLRELAKSYEQVKYDTFRKSHPYYEGRETDFYDEESIYFFDNLSMDGSNFNGKSKFVLMRKELFNRWINFAKTGIPRYSGRTDRESNKYATWEAFPKGKVGSDTNDDIVPSYLYMPAELNGGKGQRRSKMISLDELVSNHALTKSRASGTDICTWVLEEENDDDGAFVEVLLDFNANTAFDYYVTILATMNPTINYVPDREYLAELPPTLSPTTLSYFVDQSILKSAAVPPPLLDAMVSVTMVVAAFAAVALG